MSFFQDWTRHDEKLGRDYITKNDFKDTMKAAKDLFRSIIDQIRDLYGKNASLENKFVLVMDEFDKRMCKLEGNHPSSEPINAQPLSQAASQLQNLLRLLPIYRVNVGYNDIDNLLIVYVSKQYNSTQIMERLRDIFDDRWLGYQIKVVSMDNIQPL